MSGEFIVRERQILMACASMGCPSDDGAGRFWAELERDFCDDHFGGHEVSLIPEDQPCPACGGQVVPVEREEAPE